MPDSPTSGDDRSTPGEAGAGPIHDSAALLLVESLIHGLIARAHLTVQEAIEIVDIAAEVERELHEARAGPSQVFQSVLAPLGRSLRIDLIR